MKFYDNERKYLISYFSDYPYAMVVKENVFSERWSEIHQWMNENLAYSYTSYAEGCMAQKYSRQIVGWGCSEVHGRAERFLFFHDKANFDKMANYLGDLVVTTDPWGPDLCRECERTQ